MTSPGSDLANQKKTRRASQVAEVPAGEVSPYASFAEAVFAQDIKRIVHELRAKLPADVVPARMAQWILDFLDRAATPVRVRLAKRVVSVGCLEKIERNLPAEDPEECQRIVLPFWMAPEFSILQSTLFDIREEAERLKIKDPIPKLRSYLTKLAREPLTRIQEGAGLTSEQDAFSRHRFDIGYRLLVLANLIKETGQRPSDKNVCARWDLECIRRRKSGKKNFASPRG